MVSNDARRAPDRHTSLSTEPHRPVAVFVLGNGHSGSTLLETQLTASPNAVGLGELGSTLSQLRTRAEIDAMRGRRCLCGEAAGACEFWSGAMDRLRHLATERPGGLDDRYHEVIDHFTGQFPGATLVDSSKNPRYLDALERGWSGRVEVVHLVRDVRPWSVGSRRRAAGETGPGLRGLQRRAHSAYLSRFSRWRRGVSVAEGALEDRPDGHVRASYEGMVTRSPEYVTELIELLQIPDGSDRAVTGTSPAIHGNRARHRLSAGERITYSPEWTLERGWALASLLRPGVMRANRRLVGSTLHQPVRVDCS